jgi:hypothetical protein
LTEEAKRVNGCIDVFDSLTHNLVDTFRLTCSGGPFPSLASLKLQNHIGRHSAAGQPKGIKAVRRRNSLVGMLLVGAVFAGAGYFVAFRVGKPTLEDAQASERWPTTNGIIESSKVVRSRDGDGGTLFGADVVYSYSIADGEYQSSRIGFGKDFKSSDSSRAYETINRYPKGKEVEVSYHPDRPEVAVLEPGVSFGSYAPYIFGWIFLIVGCLILVSPLLKILFVVATVAVGRSGTTKM